MQGDGAVHGFEHFARADEDALQANLFHQYRYRIDLRLIAGEHADEVDAAAGADGLEGFAERAGAADFDDVIDAAGELAYWIFPVDVSLIVDSIAGAERPGPRELVVAAAGDDGASAVHVRELQC